MQRRKVVVSDAGKKGTSVFCFICYDGFSGSGLFAKCSIKKQQEITRFLLPNFVKSTDTLSNQIEWWEEFCELNGLPYDNVIFRDDGLVYDFAPPGENCWFFINHSTKFANSKPVWTGRNMIFRAIKNIKKGEEILFCYNSRHKIPSFWFE